MAMKSNPCERRKIYRRSRWVVSFRQSLCFVCVSASITSGFAVGQLSTPPDLGQSTSKTAPILKAVGIKFVLNEESVQSSSSAPPADVAKVRPSDGSSAARTGHSITMVPPTSPGPIADIKMAPIVARSNAEHSAVSESSPNSVRIEMLPATTTQVGPTKLTIAAPANSSGIPNPGATKPVAASQFNTIPVASSRLVIGPGANPAATQIKVASLSDHSPNASTLAKGPGEIPAAQTIKTEAPIVSKTVASNRAPESATLLPPPKPANDTPKPTSTALVTSPPPQQQQLPLPPLPPMAIPADPKAVASTSKPIELQPAAMPSEPKKVVSSSTPQVVRIPSMTLSEPHPTTADGFAKPSHGPSQSLATDGAKIPASPAITSLPSTQLATKSAEEPKADSNASLVSIATKSVSVPSPKVERAPALLAPSEPVLAPKVVANEPSTLKTATEQKVQPHDIALSAPTTTAAPKESMKPATPTIPAIPVSLDKPRSQRAATLESLPNSTQPSVTSPSPVLSHASDEPSFLITSPVIESPHQDSSVKRTQLEVVNRNVRFVEYGRPISRIVIEDENVCKSVATESTSFILLGVSKGSTMVTVWPDAGQGNEGQSEQYEVTVRDTWKATENESQMESAVSKARQSFEEMFPLATIVFKPQANGSLLVGGHASSNDEAKQIVQLVRKMFLVPVIDRVAVVAP